MGIITGNNSTMQIGLESTWGTAVVPTKQLEFNSESITYTPNYLESDALLGHKTTGKMYITDAAVSGNFTIEIHPDNIGLLLGATLGAEADAVLATGATSAYEHVFTLIEAGTSTSLPHLTMLIDRIVDVFEYDGIKIASMSLSAQARQFLTAEFSVNGREETEGGTLGSLSYSALPPFQFKEGTIKVDGSDYADVTSFSVDINNSLETDLFTLNSGGYPAEPEPQKREVTASMEVLYSSATNNTRTNKFKTGSTSSLVLTFESSEEIETGIPYALKIEMPLCYITTASPTVGGPDRIRQTLEVRASQDESNEPITITLTDSQDTEYL